MTGAPRTLAAALAEAAAALRGAGIEGARLEARLLLAHALGRAPEWVLAHPEAGLDAAGERRLAVALALRAERRPLAQVVGRREFWSLDFAVSEATLVPRPESETLVGAALAAFPDRAAALRVLDLGTGSGCLLLAILSERPNASGVGVEASAAAARVARHNARALGLAGRAAILVGDWAGALSARFDLVVANPPYVPVAEIDRLAPEVARFEPRRALAGGADGLASYRALAPALPRLLRPGGRAFLEVGAGQAAEVSAILARAGLAVRARHRDLAGIERCLEAAPGTGAGPVAGQAKKKVGNDAFPD
ncbi:MAG: peptide chain release factor N(5)-glutamine methyltransferase [Proteobacteria bacterium]|nr:peptide chain release factor N(5)-glutamine methyltransferase [Pseudomonadota bacterium]